MRIVFMGNNYVGWEIFKRLVAKGEDILGLVLHPDNTAKYKSHFIMTSKGLPCFTWEPQDLKKIEYLKKLEDLQPDIIISVLFGYILKQDVLKIPKKGCINIHNGYLPYNKGVNANVWSIIDGTPAGATIHYMDEGIDTGNIIARKEVPVTFSDTGKTLYLKSEEACISLFEDTWESIKGGTCPSIAQNLDEGTAHTSKQMQNLDQVFLEKTYTGQRLINLLRARTFEPFEGIHVLHEGSKYHLKLAIEGVNKAKAQNESCKTLEISSFSSLDSLNALGIDEVIGSGYENDLKIPRDSIIRYRKSLIDELLKNTERVIGYAAISNGRCLGIIVVRYSDWDSGILDFTYGNISLFQVLPGAGAEIGSELLEFAVNKAKEWDIDCLSSRISYKESNLIHALERKGFQLMDVSITLGISSSDICSSENKSEGENVRSATVDDLPELREIARSNFRYSHFHMDNRISHGLSNDLFACWTENAVKGRASEVLVLELNEEILGFVTLNVNNHSQREMSIAIGELDLLVVKAKNQGKGLGSKLVMAGLNWFKSRVQFVETRTQLMNNFAINTFKRHQVKLQSNGISLPSGATFHGWIKDK
jgi:methionyl-tRNA formyltransferase/GNAT superfamily N-acetyltransferase